LVDTGLIGDRVNATCAKIKKYATTTREQVHAADRAALPPET
jgi:hypothetical protein